MKYLKLITAFNINGGVDIPGIIKIHRRKIDLGNNNVTEELVTENNAIMMYSPLIG